MEPHDSSAFWYQSPFTRISIAILLQDQILSHGIVVSCSAGNSGPGPYTATNIAPWIVTVGASTIDREFPADVVLGDGRTFGGVSLYSGLTLPDFKLPLVYAGDVGNRYCYIGSISPSKVQGKIVVCDRGGNARVEKGAAVKLAGGLGMILANTAESGEELLADAHLIAATEVGEIAANEIRNYVKMSQFPTATILFRGTVIGPSPPAPKVAAFSSRGPNHLTAEILKPDVIAPGVNILAGWTGFAAPTDLDIDPRRVDFNIISVFVRGPTGSDTCEGKLATPGDLNYPSFSVVFDSNNHVVEYKRTVKNVGTSADAIYEAKVNAPAGVEISISPSKLEFSGENQTLSYKVTFASNGLALSAVGSAFGSIEWFDGVHRVRSPVAVRWVKGLKDSI
ncbi:hypothetical protein V6N11_030144 [Hibiscus sabdariffa]|uniref:Uncharacterized protein n=1 Tax=Hibiscus sabdariffa TaxID=183260 RepID=A0ABR2PK02_9ROSI